MSERWREILEDDDLGPALRALCRLVVENRAVVKSVDEKPLRDQIVNDVYDGRIGDAAFLMALLARVIEEKR